MPDFVLVWDSNSCDYYQGIRAALYADGVRVWIGYSNDAAGDLLEAVLGDLLTVRAVKVEPFTDQFPATLAEVDRYQQVDPDDLPL